MKQRYILSIIALFLLIGGAGASECISWKWVQTGSHWESNGWYGWYVPDYSFVCTEYAAEPTLPITVEPPGIWREITPVKDVIQTHQIQNKGSNVVFNFGSSDVERYKIFQAQNTSRGNYYMEIIADSYHFSKEQFEAKYISRS